MAGMENAIRFGASVNRVDASVHTFCALHVACQHSNVQVSKLAVLSRVLVCCIALCACVLHYDCVLACMQACSIIPLTCQSVEWLLKHGADHSVRSARGWTPLHVCAIRGGTHVAKVTYRVAAFCGVSGSALYFPHTDVGEGWC